MLISQAVLQSVMVLMLIYIVFVFDQKMLGICLSTGMRFLLLIIHGNKWLGALHEGSFVLLLAYGDCCNLQTQWRTLKEALTLLIQHGCRN
jgi:hypothetical protein